MVEIIEAIRLPGATNNLDLFIFYGMTLGAALLFLRLLKINAAIFLSLATNVAVPAGIYFATYALTPSSVVPEGGPTNFSLILGLGICAILLARITYEKFSIINALRFAILLYVTLALINLIVFQLILNQPRTTSVASFEMSVGLLIVAGIVCIFLAKAMNTKVDIKDDRQVREIREIVDRQISEYYKHEFVGSNGNVNPSITIPAKVKAQAANVYNRPSGSPYNSRIYQKDSQVKVHVRTSDNQWVKIKQPDLWIKASDIELQGSISTLPTEHQ
jgi:hypothetical protein